MLENFSTNENVILLMNVENTMERAFNKWGSFNENKSVKETIDNNQVMSFC